MLLKTLLAAALAITPVLAQGAPYPSDLQPGARFRILFVTEAARDGTSADIADYDAFVRAEADASPSLSLLATNWRAVASTPTVDAKVHTGTDDGSNDIPIYRPDGVRINDGYADLWNRYVARLAAPEVTSLGARSRYDRVWSGSSVWGLVGTDPLGAATGLARAGIPQATIYTWITANNLPQTHRYPLFGISDVVVVPHTASETVRLGSPANPEALLPGQTSGPVVGHTWDPIVDHTNFVPDALQDHLVLGFASTNLPIPGLGTLLCDLRLPFTIVATPGQAFGLPLPNDVRLAGAAFCAQAVAIDAAGAPQLTNALDVIVGQR